jgi:hypothetical protein
MISLFNMLASRGEPYSDEGVDEVLQRSAAVQHVLVQALAHRGERKRVVLHDDAAQALHLVRPDALVGPRIQAVEDVRRDHQAEHCISEEL